MKVSEFVHKSLPPLQQKGMTECTHFSTLALWKIDFWVRKHRDWRSTMRRTKMCFLCPVALTAYHRWSLSISGDHWHYKQTKPKPAHRNLLSLCMNVSVLCTCVHTHKCANSHNSWAHASVRASQPVNTRHKSIHHLKTPALTDTRFTTVCLGYNYYLPPSVVAWK